MHDPLQEASMAALPPGGITSGAFDHAAVELRRHVECDGLSRGYLPTRIF